MVKIRLQRVGAKKRPFYRVVAIDEMKRRDGAVIENLGQYQPVAPDNQFTVDEEKVLGWLKNGAQPTDTIQRMLKKNGIWKKYLDSKK